MQRAVERTRAGHDGDNTKGAELLTRNAPHLCRFGQTTSGQASVLLKPRSLSSCVQSQPIFPVEPRDGIGHADIAFEEAGSITASTFQQLCNRNHLRRFWRGICELSVHQISDGTVARQIDIR